MTDDDPLAHLDFESEDAGLNVIEPVVVHRQVLFDVAVNAKEIAEAVGLPPISDEQAVSERAASLRRLLVVNRLDPAIEDHSKFLAAVFVRIQREAADVQEQEIPAEAWQSAYDHLQHMLNTACMSLISTLVDIGALHVDEAWKQPSEQENGS